MLSNDGLPRDPESRCAAALSAGMRRLAEPAALTARLIYMLYRQCDRDPRATTGGGLTERVAQYAAGYADARAAQKGGGSSP